ncbi:MAG: hypothetical protein JKX75_01575 [Gammaproteobacteria bacterium]|nr:hypothetical protein [Gammaproteobacteria bacterium]
MNKLNTGSLGPDHAILFLSTSHLVAIAIGFSVGIYALLILIAPNAPDKITLALAAKRQFVLRRVFS